MSDSYDMYDGPPREMEDSDSDLESIMQIDPTKKKGWGAKQKLIQQCQEGVGKYSSLKRPLNIAVIGPPGCGKSSLLNTIFASFRDDKWKEIAEHGSYGGEGKQTSHLLISYNKERYYDRKTSDDQDDEVLMPTFIDMKGFENSNSPLNKELLNIVFYGRLKEGENLSDVIKHNENHGLSGLREKYGKRNEYLKVDRIVCVCSADPSSPLPEDLLECIHSVAHSERVIPLYGVMTKSDKFDGRKNAEIKKREDRFQKCLGIPPNRFARIANYCKEIDENMSYRFSVIPKIDVKVLELMQQVFSGDLQVINEGKDYFNKPEEETEGAQPFDRRMTPSPAGRARPHSPQPIQTNGLNFRRLLLIIALQVLFLSILMNFAIKPDISEETFSKICQEHNFIDAKHGIKIQGLKELCENKIDVLMPPMKFLSFCVLGVVVLVPMLAFKCLS